MIFMDRFRGSKSQSGINMVDLMMWLVIAALLLAAAIQGIGYYHRAATLANMKSDAAGAASNVISASSMDQGVVDLPTVTTGVANSKWTTGVNHSVESPSVTGRKPYIRVSSPDVTGSDVIYLFDSCGGYDVGVNVIPKNSSPALLACGVDFSGAQPVTDGSAIMTSVWDTSLTSCSTIKLPLAGTINATVDWGDGTKTTTTSAIPSHTYSGTPGEVLVKVTGTFSKWGASFGVTTPACLTRVTGWGNTATTDLSNGFNGTTHLASIAQIPTGVTSLNRIFGNSSFNGDVSKWDTSNVTDMNGMFIGDRVFNQSVANWNTAKVTNTGYMFWNATAFNQPIGNWNTANVTDMGGMFNSASAFNQPIGNWNTANVTNMYAMFQSASAFNQPIGNWNTANVVNTNAMFWNATAFNQPIGNWNTANVMDMGGMFQSASAFNQNVSIWNVAKVTEMRSMFQSATVFNQDISGWNVTKVTSFVNFYYAASAEPASYVPLKFR